MNFKDWISILESIYVLIRLLKPNLVVETGVGEIGMSSTYILTALEDNNHGHLYSIDPDKFYSFYGYHVGSGIPENLRKRHTLVYDISQNSLEPLLKIHGQIDVFLHDGDHKYKTKMFEYETAYKYLRSGLFRLCSQTCYQCALLKQSEHPLRYTSIQLKATIILKTFCENTVQRLFIISTLLFLNICERKKITFSIFNGIPLNFVLRYK